MIIAKVWENKFNNQKLVTIPKNSDIDTGNYVEIKKVKNGFSKEERKEFESKQVVNGVIEDD